jgi:hypothetical protein
MLVSAHIGTMTAALSGASAAAASAAQLSKGKHPEAAEGRSAAPGALTWHLFMSMFLIDPFTIFD